MTMGSVKQTLLKMISDGWLGDVVRSFDGSLRMRPKVLGLTNPVFMSHVVTEQAGGIYLSENDSYITLGTGRDKTVHFDPDTFEADITYLIRTLVQPDDVALDIGANIGFHTVTMAKAADRGRVYAFEPVAEMAERNSANCALNRLDNVTLIDCAGSVVDRRARS